MEPMMEARENQGQTMYTAFAGDELVASGDLPSVIARAKKSASKAEGILLFENETGRQLEVSLEGSIEEVLARVMPEPRPQGRGRPKLGVKAREVTLLPRHWDWLERQPHGISATLRRLVDEARKRSPDEDAKQTAREAAYRFMTAMAGNRPGYEEALRSLYAKDRDGFQQRIAGWPTAIREHASKLAEASF